MKFNFSKKIIFVMVLFLLAVFIACSSGIKAENSPKVKNCIIFIGDGMGEQQRRISAIVEGNGDPNYRLAMEKMSAYGLATNHAIDAIVTDSAASGTAISSGYKTKNGIIGMTPEGKSRPNILEACAKLGKSTGLITTVTITHATPACFGAHAKSRKMYSQIAPQYLKTKIDVLFGGGLEDFLPINKGGTREDGKNLIEEAQKNGYTLVQTPAELKKLNPKKDKKVLGLFAKGEMSYEVDRDPAKEPSIAEMTKAAIDILSRNPKGFFLMVEGGKIDWACHGHDVAGTVYDTIALDHAVRVALDFQKKNPDTLIIVLNDHETGGCAITSKINITRIKNLKATSMKLAEMIKKDPSKIDEIFKNFAGISDLTEQEKKMISGELTGALKPEDEWGYGGTVIANIISKRTGLMFATGGHTGAPVIVAVSGPDCKIFNGFYDQTEIIQKTAKLMGIKFPF